MTGCPHCGRELFAPSASGDRVKAATTMLVLHKSGDVEINCPGCKSGVILPLAQKPVFELRKGRVYPGQRIVFR